jgi:hypothetical protein
MRYYEVRNDNKIFSFYLHYEVIAAYPTYRQQTYTFNKKTGQLLTIDSLIAENKLPYFMQAIEQLQKASLENYKKDLRSAFNNGEIEEADYAYALEQTKENCWSFYSNRNFKLYPDRLEIIIDCEFARIYQPFSPLAILSISKKQLYAFLKPEYMD